MNGKAYDYGHIRNGKNLFYVHRLSWVIHFGPIPKGQYVLHKCDVRNCIKPSHLFLGTYKENAIDMVKRSPSSNKIDSKTS